MGTMVAIVVPTVALTVMLPAVRNAIGAVMATSATKSIPIGDWFESI